MPQFFTRTFSPDSPELPAELWQVPSPPALLYIQGSEEAFAHLLHLPKRGFAIVGTRRPQGRSLVSVQKTIARLRGSSLIIVSGFARGVDAAAHQSALSAQLPTLAILAAGLDQNYPHQHASLRNQILSQGGLLVSEFPPGTEPRPFHFLKRNRLIAAWSEATWVVEAAERSGAMNTAHWAMELGKTCLVTPCYPGDLAFGGNQKLLDLRNLHPFWGPHSLGCVWMELATTPLSQASLPFPLSGDHHQLLIEIQKLCAQVGGASLPSLIDWAERQNRPQSQVFSLLRELINQGYAYEFKGQFLPTPVEALEKGEINRLQ